MHHILDHWSGGDGQFLYDLYSGLFPFLLSLGLLTLGGAALRRINCAEPGCPRIGRHHMVDDNGHEHHVCRHHHPTGGPPRGLKHHHVHHRQLEG